MRLPGGCRLAHCSCHLEEQVHDVKEVMCSYSTCLHVMGRTCSGAAPRLLKGGKSVALSIPQQGDGDVVTNLPRNQFN